MSNQLAKTVNEIEKIKNSNKYSLLTFLPSNSAIDSKPVGYVNKLNMNLLDYSFHTPESCKLGAGMKLSDIKFNESKKSEKIPGLNFKIVNIKGEIVTQGISTDFLDINKATNNLLNINNELSYIEWYGVFIPDETAIWKININTTTKHLWLGDHAVHNYNINNEEPLDNPAYVRTDFIKNNKYPIRIKIELDQIFDPNNVPFLSISSSNDSFSKNIRYDVLYSENQNVMYYSLHEIDPFFTKNNLFACYSTYQNNSKPINIKDNTDKPQLKTANNEIYTKDSSHYLYSLDSDKKMNKMFYSDDNSFNLQYIPYQSPLLKKNPNGDYIEVGEFFPPVSSLYETLKTGISQNNDLNSCKKKCNDDKNCNYLYDVSIFNKNICVLGKENDPNNIVPVNNLNGLNQSTVSEIKNIIISNKYNPRNDFRININSSLYIKDKIIDMSNIENDKLIGKEEKKEIIKDVDGYSKYKYVSTKDDKITMNDIRKNDNEVLKELYRYKDEILYGKNESFNNKTIEPFNSYDMNDCTINPEKEGCFKFIQNKKIDPLNDSAKNYIDTNNQIQSTTSSFNNKIMDISNNWVKLKDNSSYYQLKNEKNSLMDGLKNDMDELLLQENNMYILGALTTSTLLIGAIMFSMN